MRTTNHIGASEKNSKSVRISGGRALVSQPRSDGGARKVNLCSSDLFEALIAGNIPLKNLAIENVFFFFLKNYCTDKNITDESTLRKNHVVDDIYKDVFRKN